MSNHPVVHIDIPGNDPKAAGQFYADAFGWQVETDPTFDYTMFRAEGGPGGGFVKVGGGMGLGYKAGEVLIYIGTDDIDASLASVEKHGGKTVMGKTEIPNVGWWAVFADPTGNKVALYTDMHPHPHQ